MLPILGLVLFKSRLQVSLNGLKTIRNRDYTQGSQFDEVDDTNCPIVHLSVQFGSHSSPGEGVLQGNIKKLAFRDENQGHIEESQKEKDIAYQQPVARDALQESQFGASIINP